jgi:hypothetical protein
MRTELTQSHFFISKNKENLNGPPGPRVHFTVSFGSLRAGECRLTRDLRGTVGLSHDSPPQQ